MTVVFTAAPPSRRSRRGRRRPRCASPPSDSGYGTIGQDLEGLGALPGVEDPGLAHEDVDGVATGLEPQDHGWRTSPGAPIGVSQSWCRRESHCATTTPSLSLTWHGHEVRGHQAVARRQVNLDGTRTPSAGVPDPLSVTEVARSSPVPGRRRGLAAGSRRSRRNPGGTGSSAVGTSPWNFSSPDCRYIAELHSVLTVFSWWLTKSTVRPSAGDVPHLRRGTSPGTPRRRPRGPRRSTRISGSRWAATAKASRTYMPLTVALHRACRGTARPRRSRRCRRTARVISRAPHAEDACR